MVSRNTLNHWVDGLQRQKTTLGFTPVRQQSESIMGTGPSGTLHYITVI